MSIYVYTYAHSMYMYVTIVIKKRYNGHGWKELERGGVMQMKQMKCSHNEGLKN